MHMFAVIFLPRIPVGVIVVGLVCVVVVSVALRIVFAGNGWHRRKSSDKTSHTSDTQFRTLAEAIPQIVWTASPEGPTTYINQHWYEITGNSPAAGLGDGWMESVHPDDREICCERWRHSLRSGDTFEVEHRLLQAHQTYRWYLDRAIPLRDASGAILQWFGTCTDIHDRMQFHKSHDEQVRQYTAALV